MLRWIALILVCLLVGCTANDQSEQPGNTETSRRPDNGPAISGTYIDAQIFDTGFDGYEPTIAVDMRGRIFVAGASMRFDLDSPIERPTIVLRSVDGGDTWAAVNDFPVTYDPVLHLDDLTQRIYRAHMLGTSCTNLAWSDDAGTTWIERPMACGPGLKLDFIKLGSGAPGPKASARAQAARHILYLCYNSNDAQAGTFRSVCATSLDGGLSWLREAEVANRESDGCGGVTSFPAVRPDGTVVLPLGGGCSSLHYGLSNDSGESWSLRKLPYLGGETTITPRMKFDGLTMYALWSDESGRLWLGWSEDLVTWDRQDVTPPGVRSITHVGMDVLGPRRIGFSLLGTDEFVDPALAPARTEWEIHVGIWDNKSTTYSILPDKTVQRGRICYGDSGCVRNLGDFFDAAAAPDGSLWIAYVDGCKECTEDQSDDTALMVARVRLAGPSAETPAPPNGEPT